MHPEVDDYKLYYAQVCSEWIVWRAWFKYYTADYSVFYSLYIELAPTPRPWRYLARSRTKPTKPGYVYLFFAYVLCMHISQTSHTNHIILCDVFLYVQVIKLQAGIKYAEEDLPNSKVHTVDLHVALKLKAIATATQ